MFSALFNNKPVLDDEAVEWLFNGFSWALRNLGSEAFFSKTLLVEPSNRYFPGREESEHKMASLIFERVKAYAGVSHWPCELVDRHEYDEASGTVENRIQRVLSGNNSAESGSLFVLYEPLQVRNPEAMIANFAYTLAYHLSGLAEESPPCDEEQWPYLLEVIGVYLGFGIMFVNTALPKRSGGCGSCRSPLMERHGYLSEDEVTYVLAIFCALKNIPAKEVTPKIKNYQRAFLKKAIKDVLSRKDDLERLRVISYSENGRYRAN